MPACIATDCAGALETGVGGSLTLLRPASARVGRLPEVLIAPGAGLRYSRIAEWEIAGLVTPPLYIPWELLTLCSNAPLQVR